MILGLASPSPVLLPIFRREVEAGDITSGLAG